MIKIGTVGKILKGEDAGWYVKIEDDSPSTSGYLILISSSSNMSPLDPSPGFDYWVDSYDSLVGFFYASKWIIHWLDSPEDSKCSQDK